MEVNQSAFLAALKEPTPARLGLRENVFCMPGVAMLTQARTHGGQRSTSDVLLHYPPSYFLFEIGDSLNLELSVDPRILLALPASVGLTDAAAPSHLGSGNQNAAPCNCETKYLNLEPLPSPI